MDVHVVLCMCRFNSILLYPLQNIKSLDLNYNDLLSEEGMKRIRQRRSEVQDWINELQGEEEVLLRDRREVRNATEVKNLLLELLRSDPDVRSELVVS